MTQTAKNIFMDAVEMAESERAAFVRAACENDTELAKRVTALLKAHFNASTMLGEHAAPPVPTLEPDLQAGQRIQSFRLIEEIGVGGFGSVWLAEQEKPFQRLVAVKVLKAGMDSREVVARFQAERQALALMEHSGIAKVFDAGTTELGRPFFAMELVDGASITEHAEANSLDVRDRVRLVSKICAALKHAHQKGVIHRDIKPNNVLVTEQDGELCVKVIDFGIAKATGGRLAQATIMTRADQLIGTPGYMSPEQVEENKDVDTRSDIYSVGALLYELLTGKPPIDLTTLSFAAIQRKITSETPLRPSLRLKSETSTGAISAREVRGDLDWIVMRCLEKDRDRRYDSMGLLMSDLEHYLKGEVVSAGPPTLSYRTHKYIRSHWRGLLVASAMLAMLITGVVVSTGEARKAQQAEAEARLELVRAGAVADFLQELLMGIDPALAKGRDTSIIEEILDRATASVDEASKGLPEVEANLRNIVGHAHYSIGRFPEARLQLERAFEIRKELVGSEHLDTYQAAARLGPVLGEDGEYEAATELLRYAYEGLCKEQGIGHPDTRLARSNLAATLQARDMHVEVEPLLRLIETETIEEFGAEHEESLRAQNNLGVLLSRLGQLEEAKQRLEFIADVQENQLSIEHPKTMATLNNLAGVHEKLGEEAEAERIFRELLAAKKRLLPAGHPSLLTGQNNLAHFLADHNRHEEAAEIRAAAIASSMEHHGLANRFTLTLLIGEGLAQLTAKNYELAEAAFRPVVAEAPAVFGEGSSIQLVAQSNLAEVLLRTGRAVEAAELMKPVIEQLEAAFPESSDVHRAFPARYGLILFATGDHEAALPYLQQAHKDLPGMGLDKWEARVEAALAAVASEAK